MLNPHASEFKPPAPSSASSSRPANPAPNSLKDKKHQNKKSQRKDATGIPKPVKSGKKGKGKSAQDTVASDASSSKQKPRDAHSNRKRKSAKAPSKEVQASSSQPDLMEPVKFLAIEEPIDPVMIVDGEETEVVHGYERYIDCIQRSLAAFEVMTVVGMDQAVVDVVSLITILQHRGIGDLEEVETFTTDQGRGLISCVQVKVHRSI